MSAAPRVVVVCRSEVGQPQANASFTPDGSLASVTISGGDEVVAIVGRFPTGGQPMRLVLPDPTAP